MGMAISRRLGLLLLALGSLLTFAVIGCSDDDSSTGSDNQGPGMALILIHDAPVDSLKEVWLTVSSVRLIGGDSDSADVTVLDEPLRLDFLSLDSVSRVLTLAEMEAQSFSKIRLEVSDPEFLDKDDNTIESEDIQLVANGKVDLNFQGEVVIAPDEVTLISVDLDVENSIQVNQTGNGKYILHPQFKLDGAVDPGAKVEIEDGTLVSVDLATGELEIEVPGSTTPLVVATDSGTEFKDAAGDPIGLSDLVPGMMVDIEGHIDPDSSVITAEEVKIVS
jgi:hypothetical protein